MRLIVGLVGALGITGVYADCASEMDDAQRLSCFDRLAQCQSLSQADQRLVCYREGGPKQAATRATARSSPSN